MSRISKLRAAVAALAIVTTFTACETFQCPFAGTGGGGEPQATTVLSTQEAAQKFFAAYKQHNRLEASQVASPEAIRKLNWNPLSGSGSNLQLQETDKGEWVILYDAGFIELMIPGDGRGGHTVSNVRMHAD